MAGRWDHPARPSWGQFAVWALVGPIMVAGLLAAFTPLIVITLPVAALAFVVIGHLRGINASAFGALAGLAIGPLLIAWFSRESNSTVCVQGDCTPNAWLWLAVGIGVILLGAVPFVLLKRRSSRQVG